MKAEDFSAWLTAIGGLSAAQRREALQALERAGGRGRGALGARRRRRRGSRRSEALARTRSEARVMSVWKAKGVRTARAARSSPGGVRMGFRGFAARAADARSTP